MEKSGYPCGLFWVPLLIAALSGPSCKGGKSDTDPCPPCKNDECRLAEAAHCAGIRIGVAAAPNGEEKHDRLIFTEFDALSAEGAFLWSNVHPQPDVWNFEAADRLVEFADRHQMPLLATHFVWDQVINFSTTPQWVKDINDPEELRRVLRQHMTTLGNRYGAKVHRWIGVNEPLLYTGTELFQNHFYKVLGPDYIVEVFQMAKEVAPESEWWINDIFLESNPDKADAYVALVQDLLQKGAPIDGAGVQGHFFYGEPDF